jgi:hypothetical protein
MKLEERLEKLKEMVGVQCSNGNWNYDPYMHGMANGMIFCEALMENKDPQYLGAPKVWLHDKRRGGPLRPTIPPSGDKEEVT